MLKKLTTFLYLFCAFFSIAQDYQTYYQGINKAKLSLVEDSIENGLNQYLETFQEFDFIFARDCFNALEVSVKLGDSVNTDYLVRRSIQQGIEFDLLDQHVMLTAFKGTQYWQNILSDKDSLQKIYHNNVNWEVRTEINAMFAEDQRIRDLANKNRFNFYRIKKLNKEFEEIDHKLVLRIMEITKEHGFPGERLIGLDVEHMHPKIRTRDLTAGMPIVILIHHFSQPNESYDSILLNEVKLGNLPNKHYASISDFQCEYGEGRFGNPLWYSLRFKPEEATENINKNRIEIGLSDLSTNTILQKKQLITPFWIGIR